MLWVVGVAGFQARSAPSCRAVPRWSVVPSLYEEQEKALTNRGEFEEALLGAGGPVLEATCGPLAEALALEGVARCDGVLPRELAAKLKAFVGDELDRAERETSLGLVPAECRFAEVLLRENRRDLLMPLDHDLVFEAAVAVANSAVGDCVAEHLGEGAAVYECSALLSDYGAPRQVVHPDTPQHAAGVTPLVTCFCSLQDIDPETMGPTLFLPQTFDAASHERFFDARGKDAFLAEVAPRRKRSLLRAGDVSLFDSRNLHCGTANTAEGTRRGLFYLTFKHPAVDDPGNPPSLRPCFRGGLTLADLRSEQARDRVAALAAADPRVVPPPAAEKRRKKKPAAKRRRGFG